MKFTDKLNHLMSKQTKEEEVIMEYRIKKIKSLDEDLKAINEMRVLVFIDYRGKHRIDGPVSEEDYDKYYEWLRIETNKSNVSVSNNLEDFKREFVSDPGIFVPTLDLVHFKDIEVATLKDIFNYNQVFDEYFEEAREEVECD